MHAPFDPHLEAEIVFLPTAQGGLALPVAQTYSPQFHYLGEDWEALYFYPDVETVHPGDTVTALIRFVSFQYYRGNVYPGMRFEVRERARPIGKGLVVRLLDFGPTPLPALPAISS